MSAATILEHSPHALAEVVQACWRERGIPAAELARRDGLLPALAGSIAGDAQAWRSAAQAIVRDAELRLGLDQVPGLRSRLWRDACGGILPAITLLVTELARTRQAGGELLQVLGGTLWIPDHCLPKLAYHLELDGRGLGSGWSQDPEVADLAASPAQRADGPDGGEARLWRRWRRWASSTAPDGTRTGSGAGSEPACLRAFLAHPGLVGALPASGFAHASPALAGLVAATRRHPPLAPALVLGVKPVLLACLGPPCPLARRVDLLAAPAHSRLVDLDTPAAWREAFAADPWTSLAAVLATLPGLQPAPPGPAALVSLLRAAALHASAAASPAPSGCLAVALPHQPPLPPLLLWAERDHLLVDAEGMAGLATWLGLFPCRYRRVPGLACAWPWEVLEHCGWSQLARERRWQLVDGIPGAERWIRLLGTGVPSSFPRLPAAVRPRLLDAPAPAGDLELFAIPG